MKARIVEFQNLVWEHYHATGRHDLPWRPPALKVRANGTIDPYRVLVSEVMLQQTQAGRVIQKYVEFLKRFPTLPALAAASPRDVLAAWQGLGYNRRALALHRAAREIIARHKRRVPRVYEDLVALPGIGAYTAGAVLAFAFQEPVVFIETNIRRAHLDFFFSDKENVRDRDILPLVAQTMDAKNPREWYYALMDYGAALGKTSVNANRRSAHYAKQSAFEGSDRQVRARIVRTLLTRPRSEVSLARELGETPKRITRAIESLLKDGMVTRRGRVCSIAEGGTLPV
jgi:A/G-specific adenine glycosylase